MILFVGSTSLIISTIVPTVFETTLTLNSGTQSTLVPTKLPTIEMTTITYDTSLRQTNNTYLTQLPTKQGKGLTDYDTSLAGKTKIRW